MGIPVIVEPLEGVGFQARSPFGWSADGATQEEALRRLEDLIADKMANATIITSLDTPAPHPILKYAGTWKDHPLLDDWKKAIEVYRKEVAEDPERQW